MWCAAAEGLGKISFQSILRAVEVGRKLIKHFFVALLIWRSEKNNKVKKLFSDSFNSFLVVR